MIVPMIKVYIAAREKDRERLLESLCELGVIHLVPVDPDRAMTDGQTLEDVQHLRRALHELYGVVPAGDRPELSALDAAREVLEVERRLVEDGNRLALLHHELEQLDVWGDFRLQQIEDLRQAGVHVQFHVIDAADFSQVQAECVAQVGTQPGDRIVVATASRGGAIEAAGRRRGTAAAAPRCVDDPGRSGTYRKRPESSRQRLAELAHWFPR
jgi:hypothetical protein